MYLIPNKFVPNWSTSSGEQFPHSVDFICPCCGRQVNFSLKSWQEGKPLQMRYAVSVCSGCREKAYFYWVGRKDVENSTQGELYIYPRPELVRVPIKGIDEASEFSESLERAYSAAIGSYNNKQWVAAAVLSGRVLEGITKSLLPEEKQKLSLAQQLRDLPNYVDLQKPIVTIADGIRKGRNIGAHFDAEKEPDQETVSMMLDLLDYVIEYLFILPERINELHDKLAKPE